MNQTKRITLGALLRLGSWHWLVFLLIASCATVPPATVYETPGALRTKLHGDVRTLSAVRPHLEALDEDFVALRKQGDWVKRGYFSVAENEPVGGELLNHATIWI